MTGAWARLVNIDGSDEHLRLCEEALAEIRAEERRKIEKQNVLAPRRGRFVVYDGKLYRVQTMWLERSNSELEKWGVVLWKKTTSGS